MCARTFAHTHNPALPPGFLETLPLSPPHLVSFSDSKAFPTGYQESRKGIAEKVHLVSPLHTEHRPACISREEGGHVARMEGHGDSLLVLG